MSHGVRVVLLVLVATVIGTWALRREIDTRVMAWHMTREQNLARDAANARWAARMYSSSQFLEDASDDPHCPESARCGWYGGVLPNGRYSESIIWSR